jgi:hypothetical protein
LSSIKISCCLQSIVWWVPENLSLFYQFVTKKEFVGLKRALKLKLTDIAAPDQAMSSDIYGFIAVSKKIVFLK